MDRNSPAVFADVSLSELTGRTGLPSGNDHSCFVHMICLEGHAKFHLDNKPYDLKRNDIGIWLPSVLISDVKCSKDFKATCLKVSFDLMSKNNPDIGWGIKGFLFTKESPVVHLSDEDMTICISNFEKLRERFEAHRHRFHREALGLQVKLFVLDMWNIFSRELEQRMVSRQQGSIFERFLQLVQVHCMEEREVDQYASRLFITSKYLSEICKKNSGKTASEWIHNYTAQRLIIVLGNRNLTLTEIADTFHFSSLSFFSRYVRKVLGMSPSEYRERYSMEKA